MNENQNDYKGFSLFSDIEDAELRNRNRAVVLANIAEDNTNAEKRITPKGASLTLGYFSQIPAAERADVYGRFVANMEARGFKVVSQ